MLHVIENSENQKRQYIDAETVFDELRRVRKEATQHRGGMIWREIKGRKYLVRTSPKGTHKSLGPESAETRQIFERFTARKAEVSLRLTAIEHTADEQRRLNRALRVGRVPAIVIGVLNALEAAGLSAHFMVVGTHSLYAYESACGVRIAPEAMATRDIDLLFDARKHLAFISLMRESEASFMGILKKVDKSFVRLEHRKETARNDRGFEVDVIRRMAKDGDPHPLRLSDHEDDVWAVQAPTGDRIHGASRFSQMVVGTNGEMAWMNTMHPMAFASIERVLADFPNREPLKRSKDRLQADLVEALVHEYMPQYANAHPDGKVDAETRSPEA